MSPKTRIQRETVDHHPRTKPYKPMGPESVFFFVLVCFFAPIFLWYGLWSDWEVVGSVALGLVAVLWGMVGFYTHLVSKRIDPRPEDNPMAEVADGAGEYGHYSPWSWWPLVLGLGVATAFAGAAIGWWLTGIGAAIAIGGLIGQVMEYNVGTHAH